MTLACSPLFFLESLLHANYGRGLTAEHSGANVRKCMHSIAVRCSNIFYFLLSDDKEDAKYEDQDS